MDTACLQGLQLCASIAIGKDLIAEFSLNNWYSKSFHGSQDFYEYVVGGSAKSRRPTWQENSEQGCCMELRSSNA